MTHSQEFLRDKFARVGVGTTPKDLAFIGNPNCGAAIWKRQPLKSFQAWIDAIEPDNLPIARVVLQPDVAKNAITNLAELSGLPDCRERTILAEDIAALANMFASIMRTSYLKLSLVAVTTNKCLNFQIDQLKARLICTYRGCGLQYEISKNDNKHSNFYSVPTGSPIIIKGTLWPESPNLDISYQSPPFEGTGETRLVLTLDPVEDLEVQVNQKFLH
jgi:hypothetical protein